MAAEDTADGELRQLAASKPSPLALGIPAECVDLALSPPLALGIPAEWVDLALSPPLALGIPADWADLALSPPLALGKPPEWADIALGSSPDREGLANETLPDSDDLAL